MSSQPFKLPKPFPSCPAPSGQPLPFEIDELDFSIWLKSLSENDDMSKCRHIFHVLQTLNNDYPPERKTIPGQTRLFFLDKLGYTLTAATSMLTYFPAVPDEKLGSETSEIIDNELSRCEISVWCSLELANGYALLSTEDCFKNNEYYSLDEKTSILANGIQAMGRALLYISESYSKPHLLFWHKCFHFYRLALLYKLNEAEINPNAHIIENAFKRLLVFELSNSNQFSPTEMRTIYDLLGHYAIYASLLTSVPKKKFKGIPSIDLKGSKPPVISDDDPDNSNPDQLFIATVAVASKILEATNDRRAQHLPTDCLMLLRLAKTLTLNKQRKDDRETAQGNHLGIVGFGNIVDFLRSKEIEKQNALAEIGDFDPSRPGELRELNFEISPAEHKDDEIEFGPYAGRSTIKNPPNSFQVVEFTDPSDIWKTDQPKEDFFETNMRMLDKSAKGYGLLWTDIIVKPKVGSIIGVLHKDLTIGLIRWLAQSKETGMFIGVELLGTKASVVKVTNPGYPDDEVYALFLAGEETTKQTASLIFINKGFSPNEFIFINKNHRITRYRLTKQLHLTSYINHVEVIRSH